MPSHLVLESLSSSLNRLQAYSKKEGKGYIVASFGNESGTVPYTTFMAKESFLKKDKAAAEKFTRALYKAQQWVDTHSPEEIADAVSPLFKDTSKDITVKVIERYKKATFLCDKSTTRCGRMETAPNDYERRW